MEKISRFCISLPSVRRIGDPSCMIVAWVALHMIWRNYGIEAPDDTLIIFTSFAHTHIQNSIADVPRSTYGVNYDYTVHSRRWCKYRPAWKLIRVYQYHNNVHQNCLGTHCSNTSDNFYNWHITCLIKWEHFE